MTAPSVMRSVSAAGNDWGVWNNMTLHKTGSVWCTPTLCFCIYHHPLNALLFSKDCTTGYTYVLPSVSWRLSRLPLVNTLVSLCVTDSQQQQLLFVWNEQKMNSVASQQQHLQLSLHLNRRRERELTWGKNKTEKKEMAQFLTWDVSRNSTVEGT